jgi:hypothetical protein
LTLYLGGGRTEKILAESPILKSNMWLRPLDGWQRQENVLRRAALSLAG